MKMNIAQLLSSGLYRDQIGYYLVTKLLWGEGVSSQPSLEGHTSQDMESGGLVKGSSSP